MRVAKSILIILFLGVTLKVVSIELATLNLKDSEVIRFCRQVITKSYNDIGIKVTISEFPNMRALNMAKTGIVDGELCRFFHPHVNMGDLVKVEPVLLIDHIGLLFTSKSLNERFHDKKITMKDLAGLKLGAFNGATYTLAIPKKVDLVKVQTFTSIAKVIVDRHLDGFFYPEVDGKRRAFEDGNLYYKRVEDLRTLPLYHFINKRHKHLIPQLTESIEKNLKGVDVNSFRYIFKSKK